MMRPKPPAPTPAAPAAVPAAAPAPAEPDPVLDPEQVEAARAFGTVSDDGTVTLMEAAGPRVVGQYPDAGADEALMLYIRRYLDLKAQVDLFETRLPQLSARDLDSGLTSLADALAEPAVVGDVDALRTRLAALTEQAHARKAELAAEREVARERALAVRTDIVERAEALAAMDPQKVQWRTQGERLRGLLEEWKGAQRTGMRLERSAEDALWKRFSHARSAFDRNRRQFFSELDAQHGRAKEAKEALIGRAEALSTSTDWGPTSAAMRGLMDEWKAAGRAARRDDDALWARFRAAQDVFYDARSAKDAEADAVYAQNLAVKLEILEEAERLVPVGDIEAAKRSLRGLQDRWEAAGKVPRADISRTEARMQAVEKAVREAEDSQWRSKNPQMKARAEGAAAQLEDSIAGLEDDLAAARQKGDERKIAAAQEALDARKAWLEQVLRAAQDAG